MLTQIMVEHFKCFKKLKLPLAPLTLLSGMNASGKSTTLQALILLQQTVTEQEWSTSLFLNGENITLGAASDVIDKVTGRREFKIGLQTDQIDSVWTMEADNRAALAVPLKQLAWREDHEWQYFAGQGVPYRYLLPVSLLAQSPSAQQLATKLTRLSYISADRIGPRETYPMSSPHQHTTVGPRGERTAWFLHQFADHKPMAGLLRHEAVPTLQRQTEAWLSHFFPQAALAIQPVHNANLVTLGLRTNKATDYHRPQNVGYGLTHILPILTACLGAKESDVIVIENPESHLHPVGQAEMGEFLALCANSGLQIILETHSDHILNGIRRALKKQLITPEQVAIHFFRPRQDEDDGVVISPLVDNLGNLSEWPENFFDQFDKDSQFLLGWD